MDCESVTFVVNGETGLAFQTPDESVYGTGDIVDIYINEGPCSGIYTGVIGTVNPGLVFIENISPTIFCPPDAQYDGTICIVDPVSSDSSLGYSESSSSESGGDAPKTFFGQSFTNGETKLFNGTFNSSGSAESWSWSGTGNNTIHLFNVYVSPFAPPNGVQVALRNDGPYAFRLRQLSFGFTNAPTYSTNISTQHAIPPSFNYGAATLGLTTWGSVGTPAQVTLNSGEVVKWWRSGNDTNVMISW